MSCQCVNCQYDIQRSGIDTTLMFCIWLASNIACLLANAYKSRALKPYDLIDALTCKVFFITAFKVNYPVISHIKNTSG